MSVSSVFSVGSVLTVNSVFSVLTVGAVLTVGTDYLTEIYNSSVSIGYYQLSQRVYSRFGNAYSVSTVYSVFTVRTVGTVFSVRTVSTVPAVCSYDISELHGSAVCKSYFKLSACINKYILNSDAVCTVLAVLSVNSVLAVTSVFAVCSDNTAEVFRLVIRICQYQLSAAVNFGFYYADTVCAVLSVLAVGSVFAVLSGRTDNITKI